MACVCSRYNARSDWLIVTEFEVIYEMFHTFWLNCRALFSRNTHGPMTGLQKTKQKIIAVGAM